MTDNNYVMSTCQYWNYVALEGVCEGLMSGKKTFNECDPIHPIKRYCKLTITVEDEPKIKSLSSHPA